MSSMTRSPTLVRPPTFPPWPGLVLGLAVGFGLYFLPRELRPPLGPVLRDLWHPGGLAGIGISVALLVTLLGEWLALGWRRADVARMVRGDSSTWTGEAMREAVFSSGERLGQADRLARLKDYERRLRRYYDGRWWWYFVLAVFPAACGLVVGLRDLRINLTNPPQPFVSYFLLLLVGSGESLFLLLVAALTRWQASRMVCAWREKAEELDRTPQPQAAAPLPAAAPAEQATRPRPQRPGQAVTPAVPRTSDTPDLPFEG